MRIIGLDFGSRTVGVAVCDPLMITAQGVEIIRRKEENKLRQTYARIEELCAEYNAERIVLGLPKNMNNTSGDRVDKTMDFKAALERRTGLEVVMWDERLTTVAADNAMMEAGIRRENRKEYVDMIAAQLILQGYLDSLAAEERIIMEKIKITAEDGEIIELFVIEQTRLEGINYLLVTETEDEEAEAYILKDISSDDDKEAVYEFVDDDNELDTLAKLFSELIEDTEII